MEIVIAILLALILVALVSSNKEAANSVGGAVRIFAIISLAVLSYLIFIGLSLYYYFSETSQGWMSTAGLIFGVVMPLLASWLGRSDLIKFCKQDNKIVFKTLIYILLGVIAWSAVSIFFYEQRKTDPDFGWGFLIVTCVISGCIILNRCLDKGWKKSLMFQPSAFEQVVMDYDKLQAEENARWKAFSDAYTGDKDDFEYKQLMEDHFDKYDAIDRECEVELDNVRGLKKKNDWVLFAFYVTLGIMVMKMLGHVYDYAFDYVMTFNYVKGREWLANATLIGAILGAIGVVFVYYDDKERKKQQERGY